MQYESNGFLEKNRDTVSKELVNVLRSSKLRLCQKLMNIEDSAEVKEAKSNTSLGGRVVISASKTLVSLRVLLTLITIQLDLVHNICKL